MSRTGDIHWRKRSDFTPLGHLLTKYMRKHFIVAYSELAEKFGLSQQCISDYLKPPAKGVTTPQPQTLARIAQVTGIPLARLYRAAGIPMPYDDRRPEAAKRRRVP